MKWGKPHGKKIPSKYVGKSGTIIESILYTKKRYEIEKYIFNEIFGEYVCKMLLFRAMM